MRAIPPGEERFWSVAERVGSLVADGGARPFAPAGRTSREWAAVPPESIDSWEDLIGEALAFVGGLR